MDMMVRRVWHCGYLDRDEWRVPCELPPVIGGVNVRDDLGICPGWLVRQPAVIDAARATKAYRRGALSLVFPALEEGVLEAAELGDAVLDQYEAEQTRKLRANHGD